MEASSIPRGANAAQLAADNKHGGKPDGFWPQPPIDNLRWDKSYPFQLLVVRRIVGGYKRDARWQFTLPIPPEAIEEQTLFAINLLLTQGGIVEEHSGTPIKPLMFSGTTGVLPLRGQAASLTTTPLFGAVFAGAITQAQEAAAIGTNLASDIRGPRFEFEVHKENELSGALGKTSGYAQFLLLRQWLEAYAAMKKRSDGQDARLALALWKRRDVYLVTPQVLSVKQQVPDTLEYHYSLSVRAWRRILLDGSPAAESAPPPVIRNPNAMARLLTGINDARAVILASRDVIEATVADASAAILEPLRSTCLFLKDAVGAGLSMLDMPTTVIRNCQNAVLELLSTRDVFDSLPDAGRAKLGTLGPEVDELRRLGAALGKGQTRSGSLPDIGSSPLLAGGATDVFRRPEDYPQLFDTIRLGDLNLPAAVVSSVARERERVRALGRADFARFRDELRRASAQYAEVIGAGSAAYRETYGLVPPPTRRRATDSDFATLHALGRFAMGLASLAAYTETNRFRSTSLEQVAGLAERTGLAFKMPRSKYLVPFPVGGTLQRLAARYLDDPGRWFEIAALNGLREPYVDEEGVLLPLLVNGRGNSVVLADAFPVRAGRIVYVLSQTFNRSARLVSRVEPLPRGQVEVILDGDSDLSSLRVGDGAVLQAYLPGTINSTQLLFIPSDQDPVEEGFVTKTIPGVNEFDPLIRAGGIDLLLTEDNELAITSDGDCRLAIGLTALAQAVRVAVGTKRGSMARHPSYGLDAEVGQPTTELTPELVAESVRQLLDSDPRFAGVRGVQVVRKGPALTVRFGAVVAGLDNLLPLQFVIQR